MDCKITRYSRHVLIRMFERGFIRNNIESAIKSGRIIEDYPDDSPLPSSLILGTIGDNPVHLVVAFDKDNGYCIIITVYSPDSTEWEIDWKTRRKK